MTKVTAIKNYITTEDKVVTIKIIGNFVPWSYGHRDKYGAPEEPDEPAHFDILETSIDGVDYDNKMISELLGIAENEIDSLLEDSLSEAYEEHIEACQEIEAENRLDVFRDFEDY